MNPRSDPFRRPREETGLLECEFQGEYVPIILRHEDVRQAAKGFAGHAPVGAPTGYGGFGMNVGGTS